MMENHKIELAKFTVFCVIVVIILLIVRFTLTSDKKPEVYESFTKENMAQAFEYGYRKGIADMTVGDYNVKVAVDSFKIILDTVDE